MAVLGWPMDLTWSLLPINHCYWSIKKEFNCIISVCRPTLSWNLTFPTAVSLDILRYAPGLGTSHLWLPLSESEFMDRFPGPANSVSLSSMGRPTTTNNQQTPREHHATGTAALFYSHPLENHIHSRTPTVCTVCAAIDLTLRRNCCQYSRAFFLKRKTSIHPYKSDFCTFLTCAVSLSPLSRETAGCWGEGLVTVRLVGASEGPTRPQILPTVLVTLGGKTC